MSKPYLSLIAELGRRGSARHALTRPLAAGRSTPPARIAAIVWQGIAPELELTRQRVAADAKGEGAVEQPRAQVDGILGHRALRPKKKVGSSEEQRLYKDRLAEPRRGQPPELFIARLRGFAIGQVHLPKVVAKGVRVHARVVLALGARALLAVQQARCTGQFLPKCLSCWIECLV